MPQNAGEHHREPQSEAAGEQNGDVGSNSVSTNRYRRSPLGRQNQNNKRRQCRDGHSAYDQELVQHRPRLRASTDPTKAVPESRKGPALRQQKSALPKSS